MNVTYQELYDQLDYVNHSREKRAYYAHLVLENPHLFPHILKLIATGKDTRSDRAAWVAEFVCKQQLTIIYDHLSTFCKLLPKVRRDSSVRPVAKVCEYLMIAYYKKVCPLSRKRIQTQHKTAITEACFDWLITDQKVAVKAYAMQSLFLLGTENPWIHEELLQIIDKDYADGSAAFKARSRHTIDWIHKHRKKG